MAISSYNGGMKIMLVDDSAFIILICRHALEKSGFEIVGEAHNGQEAIQKASELRPDLIVMDIALPKVNGFEATQAIHEFLPKTKVLAISALDDDWVKQKAISSGCFDFLTKPFDAVELIDRVEQARNPDGGLKFG